MSIGEQAANVGQEVGQALSRKAEDIAGHSKEAGADAVASAARAAEAVAESIGQQSPAVADYVRDAGQKIDRLAHDLREKSVGDLLNAAIEFGRSQPVALVAGAALVGFALSRLIKAGVTSPPGEAAPSGTAPVASASSGSRGVA